MRDCQVCYEKKWKETHITCFGVSNRRDLENWIVILNKPVLFVMLQNLFKNEACM